MSKISLNPPLLRNKKLAHKIAEEIHPLTRKSFEMALKKVSRKIAPEPQKQEPDREGETE